VRVRSEIWNLRTERAFEPLLGAMVAAARWPEFHVVHYSIQGNHIHFIVEAASKEHLARGMQALCIRMALQLNLLMGRKRGRVFVDRYHAHILKTPTEVARALNYVLGNRQVHLARQGRPIRVTDHYDRFATSIPRPFTQPETWLLRVGWTRLHL
jgi:hypothetical protein